MFNVIYYLQKYVFKMNLTNFYYLRICICDE